MSKSRLFVYGTLLRAANGKLHPLFENDAVYLTTGFLPGRLYRIGDYPGLVPTSSSAAEKVYGELYDLRNPERLLQRLDDYEECSATFPLPHEYRRVRQQVTTADGLTHSAWVYLYNRPTTGLHHIISGDYRPYLREN